MTSPDKYATSSSFRGSIYFQVTIIRWPAQHIPFPDVNTVLTFSAWGRRFLGCLRWILDSILLGHQWNIIPLELVID
ncbi:hypothetical protein Peur_039230 [Populus x canadensis]